MLKKATADQLVDVFAELLDAIDRHWTIRKSDRGKCYVAFGPHRRVTGTTIRELLDAISSADRKAFDIGHFPPDDQIDVRQREDAKATIRELADDKDGIAVVPDDLFRDAKTIKECGEAIYAYAKERMQPREDELVHGDGTAKACEISRPND